MGKKKRTEEPPEGGDWWNAASTIPKTFPNGMPRWVTWYDVQNGVCVVLDAQGVQHHVWSDHRLHVDVKKTCCFFHEWMEPEYPGGPMVSRSGSDYENTEEEAFYLAYHTQKDLERDGEFVPIFVRD